MKPARTKRESIQIRGARTHNLKNVSCSIPLNELTVITGVSGSGKSSLAFDTLYAEGQRRYVESLSAYARQFLERMDKPDVDEILGIAPAIAIKQKNSTRNPRSTVATQTEIYDYLRLLFARVGKTFCYKCNREVLRDSPESAANEILERLDDGTKFYVLLPVEAFFTPNKDRQNPTAVLMSVLGHGFSRIYRQGEALDLGRPEDYPYEDFKGTTILVDRLKSSARIRRRLVDSLEICFRESGSAIIETTSGVRLDFSESFICKDDQTIFEKPEPSLFSFNSPFGACPTCQGFGNTTGIDYDLIVPDYNKSLKENAIEPFSSPQHRWAFKEMKEFAEEEGIPMDVPFGDLTDSERRAILKGKGVWRGIPGFFRWKEKKKYKLHVRVFLAKYRGYTTCPSCEGGRLRIESRCVKIEDKNLPEVVSMAVDKARVFFGELKLEPERAKIGEKLLHEITRRIGFLSEVGLDYLTLDRLASTLSGGEAQRIQLATNLGSSLVGALYVLDEPSIGLHPRDNSRLIGIL
ncbi:MAG: excinuclease ABC subunit A, partial [Acidobacteriota bacterium]|nr:excinuclease ABC subunit A [Acidobacteriota bacterium]